MTRRVAVIVAGGKGLRMGADLPKQFISVGGEPVLMHTLRAFHCFDRQLLLILVLPKSQQDFWKQLCEKHRFEIPHGVADGGETRFHSVKNGLEKVTAQVAESDWDQTLVAVHDGVRPFVSQEVIARCFAVAAEKQSALPVIPVVETVRRLTDGEDSVTVPRDDYRLVQTPQVFNARLLMQAYQQPYIPSFTDDASVVEAAGAPIFLTDGNRENIKITTPFDLVVAEALLGRGYK